MNPDSVGNEALDFRLLLEQGGLLARVLAGCRLLSFNNGKLIQVGSTTGSRTRRRTWQKQYPARPVSAECDSPDHSQERQSGSDRKRADF